MGQKVNPIGLRIGINKNWQSRWFANKKDFPKFLHNDLKIKSFIKKKLNFAGISKVECERAGEKLRVKIFASRPGLIIGRKGSEVDKLKEDLQKMNGGQITVDIHEIKNPDIDAQLIAMGVALQLEKRVSFRRAMKKAVTNCLAAGGLGIKIGCSGRLGGAEMARDEGYKEGKVPLHTLRADIDYGFAEAATTYGIIGVKVWVYKGEILGKGLLGQSALSSEEPRKENKREGKKGSRKRIEKTDKTGKAEKIEKTTKVEKTAKAEKTEKKEESKES